jgi:hypothetical protein
VLLLVILVPLHGNEASAETELFVAPNGDDANAGTEAAPFATLDRARQAVRDRIEAGLEGDVRIEIAGGRYVLDQAVGFGPADSPPNGHLVTYAAAPGETPRFTGGRRITDWNQQSDGTWRATLPAVKSGDWRFDRLWVDGQPRPQARFPNAGYRRVKKVGPDKRTSFTFNEGDIPEHADGESTELVFLHDWSISRVPVEGIDHQQNRLTAAANVGPPASHYEMDHYEPHPRYFLEGDRAFLDAPGEWHLNEQTGVLTYMPRDGETPEDVTVVAPKTPTLLQVRGKPGRPVRNLHFDGLHFAHANWQKPGAGYAAGQATFHADRTGGVDGEYVVNGRTVVPPAIDFTLARHCRFTGGRVAHMARAGIRFGQRSDNCVLRGNLITDTAGNGVMIGENRARRVDGRPWWQAAPKQVATGNTVAQNVIEKPGRRYYGAVAVWVGFARGTTVAHNEVRNTPYTGISLGWMWNPQPTPCRDNQVVANHIHHVMQTLSDGGGIYTLGRQSGSTLRANHIHAVPLNAGRAESNGMFLDQGTKGFTIENNVIHNLARSPLRFHQAHENLVRDNTLVRPGENIPMIRYNNTNADLIEKVDNHALLQAQWTPGDKDRRVMQQAGVEKPQAKRLPVTDDGD